MAVSASANRAGVRIDTKKIELLVSQGELTIRLKKRWIMPDGLIQQINRAQKVWFCAGREICLEKKKIFGAAVEVESGKIGSRWTLDG